MYTGIGVPFPFVWIGYILCYYICKFGVGFCCFLSLVYKVFLGPRKARVMRVIDSYAFLFIIAITNTNNLLCLGNRWSIFIGLGDTDMAKKIDLQALYQQINELQIDKDLNRGKLHPLSEKFTIFATWRKYRNYTKDRVSPDYHRGASIFIFLIYLLYFLEWT